MRLNFRSIWEVNPADADNIRLVLGNCPGDERHRMLKVKADHLRDNFYEPEEAVYMLRAWLTRAEKYSTEITDTVRRSWAEINQSVISSKSSRVGNALNTRRVLELFERYGGYEKLVLLQEGVYMTTQQWLSQLYQPQDLLCLGWSMYDTKIMSLSEILSRFPQDNDSATAQQLRLLHRTSQYCLLTPAVYREQEILHEGRYYGRCDLNVLERKYWVLEFDIAEKQGAWINVLPHREYDGFDLQAAIVLHLLALGYPVVSVVHSGKKSLHVWCSGAGFSNEEIEELILATSIYGSDFKAGLTHSQFFRLPNPIHPSRPQRLLYFDPNFLNHGRTSQTR